MLDGVSLYTGLKFVHILLAILAVGLNASYGIWLAQAKRQPEHAGFALRGVKRLDDWLANPSYVLLLVTGIGLAQVGRIPLTTFWVAGALALWLVAAIIGFGFYSPALRRQIRALDAGGPTSPEYVRLSKRATLIGISNIVPVLLILILMVFKPLPG
jgi:uncharacterized membrane protein